MTPSEKRDLVSRVKWIHKNRKKSKELELEKDFIQVKIVELAKQTLDQIELLKRGMAKNTEVNLKIDGRYYNLVQHSTGVSITEFLVLVED